MNAKDVIKNTIAITDMIVNAYTGDLGDGDLLVVPVPGVNPLAWQLGHLMAAERHWVEALRPGTSPALPPGFDEAHSKEALAPGSTPAYLTKDEYLSLWKEQRVATLGALEATDEAGLDAEAPEKVRHFMPTVGVLFNMVGLHPMMHVGQWAVLRRTLGKPVVI